MASTTQCYHILPFYIIIVFLLFLNVNYSFAAARNHAENNESSQGQNECTFVHIGVVLDLDSPMGSMTNSCISMALSDFYLESPTYRTRLQFDTKDAKTMLEASFAVLDLLKHVEVHGILGPQGLTEEKFAAELGAKVHVPVISFTPRSSMFPYAQNPYFLRTTPDDMYQAQALAAICQGYEWPQVVILYEDTEYGNQFLLHLNKAFEEVAIGIAYLSVISTSLDDIQIRKELNKLESMQARVFVVHMNPSLGYRFFSVAKREGMMSEGYAWIITDSLSNSLNSMNFIARDSMEVDLMEGVLGIRPYVPKSQKLDNFQRNWVKNMVLNKSVDSIGEFTVYGLWVYDTVWSLAMAAEKIRPENSSKNVRYDTNMKISAFGPIFLSELLNTRFRGLSGDFELINGELKPSAYEIISVCGNGQKTLGFWKPDKGLTKEISSTGEPKNLKNSIWPGGSVTRPNGWAIPVTQKIRVGVPLKYGFKEMVNVTVDPVTKRTNATGYAIDIFLAAISQLLPFRIEYEFSYFNISKSNMSYDNMLHEISQQRLDMVVADTTIWAPRAHYVDFTLPYSVPGAVLVVKNRKPNGMWNFIKPFSWDLWLAITVACILMGIVLQILEHRVPNTNEELDRPHIERLGMIYWSPIAVLAFPERNMVANSWSIFVLVFWLFMAFILMQSYTANLSAILTVNQLTFKLSKDSYVGYQEGSFMKLFLTQELHINESMLKEYSSAEEYHDAMSTGEIDAILDEIPYMKLFLNKYGSQYRTVGQTYMTSGFAFAFHHGSSLAVNFSNAILSLSQSPNMKSIELKNFGSGYPTDQDPFSSNDSSSSLTLYDSGGVFIIVGSITIIALICSETSAGRKFSALTTHYSQSCFQFMSSIFRSTWTDSNSGNSGQQGEEESSEPIHDSGATSFEEINVCGEPSIGGVEEISEPGQNNEKVTAQDQEVELS